MDCPARGEEEGKPKEAKLESLLSAAVGRGERTLKDVLLDKGLASLGDAYLNLLYSLTMSLKKGSPSSGRVSNRVLAEALRSAGLRTFLPRRLSRHDIGGSVEALIIYAVGTGLLSSIEVVETLRGSGESVKGFARILELIVARWPP